MAALAGVVTLASCVKDDESASVTAIRNAKAAQLNADATYKQAQAANEQAQAAYNQADAAFRTAQARQEAVQASIDEAKQTAEIAKVIAQANRDAAQADQAWQQAIITLAGLERQELDQLIGRYQLAVGDYQTAVDNVLTAKANLKTAQLNKEYAVKSLENSLKGDKANLAEAQARLAALKEIETTGMTQAEKTAALEAKQAELDNAKSAFDQSAEVAEFEAAAAALKLAKDAYDEANQAIVDVNNINFVFRGKNETIDADDEPFADFKDYTYNAGMQNFSYWTWWFNITKFVLDETNKLNADRMYANNVKVTKDALDDATDLLGTTADTKDTKTKREANKDAGGNQLPTLYADLATANAMPETTDAEKAAKKAAIEAAEDNIATQIDLINYPNWGGLQYDYDEAVADQKEFNDAFAAVDLDEYAEIIEALQEAADNYNEAATAVDDLEDDVQALQDEYNALNNISVQNIDDQIKDAEDDIAWYEEQIAEKERLIDPANYPLTYDEVIAELELDLAKKQAEVEVQAAKLAIAKEELEEAIGDFDPEEINDEPAADADADTEG